MSTRAAGGAPAEAATPGAGGVPALRFDAVRFGYGARPVLDGIDLTVGAGEMVGLLGPNGAGKTTLLRLATGILHPASGEVRLFGREISSVPRRERARLAAVVPQEARATFDFTVREMVLMGRAPHLGLLGIEHAADLDAAEAALRATGLVELADARLREMSGGEKQRVLLARALAQEAPLLLLDEPTAFLDLRHRLEVYRLAARLRSERGLTIVAVSHDVNLAARFCPRLVLLHAGRIAADGPPEAVVTRETIRRTYGAEVTVLRHPSSGTPLIA
jgi:iron complex transport system ATP-binding protein